MNQLRSVRHAASVVFALCGTLFGIAIFASPGFALTVPPPAGALAQPNPAAVNTAVGTGMAGWQITLIAVGAALFGAMVAVLFAHARTARRMMRAAA